MLKKFLAYILAAMLLTANASAAELYVGFSRLDTETPLTIVDGRMLVPLRAFFEALGATVVWNQDTHTATAYYLYTPVAIQIGSNTAYINGQPQTLDVPAQLIDGCTMVPARFIAESFKREVTWYQETQTAAIVSKGIAENLYVTENGDSFHYTDGCNGNICYNTTWAEVLGRQLHPCEECVPFAVRLGYPDFNESQPDNSKAEGVEADSSDFSGNNSDEIISIAVVPGNGSTSNSGNSSNSGSKNESSTTNEVTGNLNRKVYWVNGGKSYHFSSGCRSLARSKNIREGTLQDALNAGKTDPCNNCAGGR